MPSKIGWADDSAFNSTPRPFIDALNPAVTPVAVASAVVNPAVVIICCASAASTAISWIAFNELPRFVSRFMVY